MLATPTVPASMTAARSVHWSLAVAHTPSPGLASGASAVSSTVKVGEESAGAAMHAPSTPPTTMTGAAIVLSRRRRRARRC